MRDRKKPSHPWALAVSSLGVWLTFWGSVHARQEEYRLKLDQLRTPKVEMLGTIRDRVTDPRETSHRSNEIESNFVEAQRIAQSFVTLAGVEKLPVWMLQEQLRLAHLGMQRISNSPRTATAPPGTAPGFLDQELRFVTIGRVRDMLPLKAVQQSFPPFPEMQKIVDLSVLKRSPREEKRITRPRRNQSTK